MVRGANLLPCTEFQGALAAVHVFHPQGNFPIKLKNAAFISSSAAITCIQPTYLWLEVYTMKRQLIYTVKAVD